MMLNIKEIIRSNKKFFLLTLFLFGHLSGVSASMLDEVESKKGHYEWEHFVITEPLSDNVNADSESKVEELFKGKKIIIEGGVLSVNNVCRYEYYAQQYSPQKYWGSDKVIAYYKLFFSGYNVMVPDRFLSIMPVDPSGKCQFPFSEFLLFNNEAIFFYGNHIIIYYRVKDSPDTDKKDISKEDGAGQRAGDTLKFCKDIERDPEGYDTSLECFYKGMSIMEAYQLYRNELIDIDKGKFLEKIHYNKNVNLKCKEGCISIHYKWSGPDYLLITQQYDGGETEISFHKEKEGCRVFTKSYPD